MRTARKDGYKPTQIERVPTEMGQSIEEMIRRAIANNEPIDSVAPMLYTEKADGVRPEFDIRTDRQELAIDATDKFAKSDRMRNDNWEMPETQPEKTE